ncbi:fibronectin type III domain-containing protein [Geomonas sp. RF6]|uniref:fibronectin type III domain-containing protein n=1 Tax=Geomonas sp. RF6 TaxID=2897342 RepID=UPI001E40DE9C|nr:fibronectin type III domain-containing protein [Geomonas sp. RF6]UFS71843.1 fibronectin type III domain-containing protein [Geomonas sp. RF6]
MLRTRLKIAVCLTTFVALCGCGKKGALLPPEALVPAAINDLQVRQKGDQFQVSWSGPAREESGARLQDLAGFVLLRHQVIDPASDCDLCPDAYRVIATIDLDYLKDVRRSGSRYVVADRDLTIGTTYRYKVRSFKQNGTSSKDSNKVQRPAHTPPPPPSASTASSSAGVTVTFSSPPLLEGKLVGYDVYRRTGTEEFPVAPLNPAPVPGPYLDQTVRHGASYIYSARTVVKIGEDMVESAPSAEVKGEIAEPE